MTKGKKRYRFNWFSLNPEVWRGTCLSFPLKAELVMVPEFDELVISAVDTFPEYELVPMDDVKVRVLEKWERSDDGEVPFNSMGASDLGLRLHYLESEHKDFVLRLGEGTKPKELIYNA